MSTAKRVLRNIFSIAVAEIVSKVFALVLFIYAARILGVANFGKYALVMAFIVLFIPLADFGIGALTVREVAREKDSAQRYLANTFSLRFIFSILAFLLLLFVVRLLRYPAEIQFLAFIGGISLIFISLSDVFGAIFRAFEYIHISAGISMFVSIFTAILGVSALVLGYGLKGLITAFLIANVLGLLLYCLFYLKVWGMWSIQFDLDFWRQIIKEAYPFIILTILGIVYFKIDTVMLSKMKTNEVVGWYNAAYKLIEALLFIPGALMVALFPVMSRLAHSSLPRLKDIHALSVKTLLVIGLPIAVGSSILARKIILLIYGCSYLPSAIALQILIWALVLTFFNTPHVYALLALDQQRSVVRFVFMAVCLNVALNFMLIPPYGYIGASLATLASEVFVATLYYQDVSKYLERIKFNFVLSPRLVVGVLVMGIFVYLLRMVNIFIVVPIAALLYFLVLYALKVISRSEIEILREAR